MDSVGNKSMKTKSLWYDRNGNPIRDIAYYASLSSNNDYKRVAETTLPDGKWISTVWLGLDHSFDDGPPMIFETMVFASKEDMSSEIDMQRYSTEAEAIKGHEEMVNKYKGEAL